MASQARIEQMMVELFSKLIAGHQRSIARVLANPAFPSREYELKCLDRDLKYYKRKLVSHERNLAQCSAPAPVLEAAE